MPRAHTVALLQQWPHLHLIIVWDLTTFTPCVTKAMSVPYALLEKVNEDLVGTLEPTQVSGEE